MIWGLNSNLDEAYVTSSRIGQWQVAQITPKQAQPEFACRILSAVLNDLNHYSDEESDDM